MARTRSSPVISLILAALMVGAPYANPEGAREAGTVSTFSDGSSEENLTFPDGGGWDNSTSITIPAGVRVTGANVTLTSGAVTRSGSLAANASELAASGRIENLTLRGDNLTLADSQFWWGQNLTTTFNGSELDRTVFRPGKGITLEKNYNSQTISTFLPEFAVTNRKDAIQPKIVMDTEGNSFIVWADARTGYYNLYAQILNRAGTPFGPEIVVCDAINNQETPAIAINPSNLLFIVWTDARNSNPDIFGRIYNNDGTPKGADFVICNAAEQQTNPVVAAGPNGNFIVAWQDNRNAQGHDIYGKIYSPDGIQNGSEIAISTVYGTQANPDIAVDSNNNFIVTWDNGGVGNPTGIYARRYHEDGTPYAAEFTVRYAQNDKLYPTIAFNSSDNFTIAWSDYENPAANIYARLYDSSATPIGDYRILVSEQNSQIRPQIAVNSRDNWVLVWNDYRNAPQHNYVRRFTPALNPFGSEALVSSFNSVQYEPQFSIDSNNDEFLIVWGDYRNGKPDIYAKRMGVPYQSSGIILSPAIDFPGSILLNLTVPADTGYSMSVIDAATNATLQSMVKHGDFAREPLSGRIRLRLVLSTDNGIISPTLSEWGIGTRSIDAMDSRLEGTFNNTTINNGLRLNTIKYENWTQLSSSTTSYGHSAVWDPINNRMIIFGGYTISGITDSLQYYWPSNDTWATIPVSQISARYQHTAVWDDQNNRMLVLAGFPSGLGTYNDLWSYDPINNSWQHVSDITVARGYHMAAWDSHTKQMFIFGGRNSGGTHLDDLLAYSPSTNSWAKKATGPSARIRSSLTYDPIDEVLILYGGYSDAYSNETWIYYPTNDTWVQKKNGPSTRYGHTAVWDTVENRMLMFAGNNGSSLNDLWSYLPEKDQWTKLTNGATGRLFHTAVWDGTNDQMLVFAGDGAGQGMLSDLWSYRYADNAWLQKSRPGFSLALCAAAWDPDHDQMLVFGGQTNNANFPSDLWAYKPLTDSWTKKASGPTGRVWPTMVWDSDNHQMLVFGGSDATKSYNDLWAYNPASDQWTQKTSADYTRSRHCAVYDPDNHQMIVFGGYRDSSPLYETVVYSPSTDKWTNKADAPEFRYVTFAVWDPDHHQMLVFGGDGTNGRTSNILVYSPSQNRWRSIDTNIPGRIGHVCTWDTNNHRMLVFGGYTDKIQNDLWAFSPEMMTSTYICRGATSRYLHAAAWDSTENHLLVFGGCASNYYEDLWSYGFSYADSGSFISVPKDLGNPASIGPISWELEWPKSCYVVLAVRTSHDNQSWSGWENITNSLSPKTTPVDRYIQYRVDMSTVHNPMTPTVFSVTINYSRHLNSGSLIASFNSSGNNMTAVSCYIDATTNGGDITVLISTDNGTTWQEMVDYQSVPISPLTDEMIYRIKMNVSPDGKSPFFHTIYFEYDYQSLPSELQIVSGGCYATLRQYQQEVLADINDLFSDWFNNTTAKPETVTLSVYSATAGTLHLSNLNITYETGPVTPTNQPPVISNPSPPDNSTVNTTDVLLDWSATDPDNDTLSFELILNGNILGWNVSRPYLVTGLSHGTEYAWQIRANDTHQWADGPVWHFTISWAAVNNTPPRIDLLYPPDTFFVNSIASAMKLEWSGLDVDSDSLNYTLYLDFINATTEIARTTAEKFTVQGLVPTTFYYWKVIASDGKSNTTSPVWSFHFNIVTNHPPVFTTSSLPNATVGKTYQFRLKAEDRDNNTLAFALLSGPAGMTIDTDGTVRWKPTSSGTFPFTVRVSDGETNDTRIFEITVLQAIKPLTLPITALLPLLLLIIVIMIVAMAYVVVRRYKMAIRQKSLEAGPSETGVSGQKDLSLIKETRDILAQLQTELAAPSDVLKLKQAEDLLADTSNPANLGHAHAILTSLVASLKDTAGASESKVEFLSEVEFYAGFVRLKAAMINRSDTVITDARFKLIYDTKSLRLSKMEPEYPVEAGDVVLGNLNPGDKKAAAFYLDPLICTESTLNGLASFKDSRGNLKALTMKPKKAAVVCPIFHTDEQINVAMLRRMTEGELTRQDRKAFKIPASVGPEGAFELGKAVVSAHDVRLIREFIEQVPYAAEAWYYGKTKPAGRSIIMRVRVLEDLNILEFFVACDDKRLLTGLLAELAHNLVTRQKAQKAIQSPEPVSNEDVLEQLIKVKPLLSKLSEDEAPAGEIETEPQKPAIQSPPARLEQTVAPIPAKTPIASISPKTPLAPISPKPPVAPIQPKQEPALEAKAVAGAMPAGATRIVNPFKDETMALKTLSNIPRGLPGSLSGRSMDELAEELVLAQFAETADGDTIVKLGKKWYFGDPKQADTYLQPYRNS